MKTFKIGKKEYTHVNYKKINDELDKFLKYSQELDVNMPDYNSEVWQVASHMVDKLESIKNRAIRLEKEFNKNI